MNNTYGQLPTVVRHDSRVSDFQCRLYAEIQSLSNKYNYCFASNDYLAKAFGKTSETISRAISGLQKLGYLNVVIEDGYKRKIKVKMDFSDMEGVDENVKGGCQKEQGGLSKRTRGVDENVNHNNIIKEDKYNKIIENKPDLSKIEIVKEVIDCLNAKANTSFKATTKETMQFVLARQKVDGWELEDFKLVIDFKVNDWGKDDRMKQYICPSTLFRASNAEKYMQAAKAWKESSKVGQNGQIRYSKEEKISLMKYDRILPTPNLNKV